MTRLIITGVFTVTLFILIQGVYLTRLEQSGEPLFLTPYIDRDDVAAGRKAALTKSLFGDDNIISYSGYFTVNRAYNSNMFFWFFPAERNDANAPFIVWLNGGPGISSIYGLFELGPYNLNEKEQLKKRDLYWSQKYNVLYLDNPIGTGFSYTEQDEGYSRSEMDIGQNLYAALQQFFKLFPQYRVNNLYIAGSSYAGKFVPALAYTIHFNQRNHNKINLQGLIIGNGFSDPATIINRSEILYNTGLIGYNFKIKLDTYIDRIVSLINQGKFEDGFDVNTVMREEMTNVTGYTSLFNVLFDTVQYPFGNLSKFINSNSVKSKIHVGNREFKTDPKLYVFLKGEILTTVKPWVEVLLEHYRLLMYSGQLDLEIPYVSNSKYLLSLKWSGADEFKNAERKHWKMDNKLVGYINSGGKLTEALIRNAGHAAHIEKPKELFNLITEFINNKF